MLIHVWLSTGLDHDLLPWYISISDLLGISFCYSVSDQSAEPKATALKEILISLLGIHGMLVQWASWSLKRRQQPRNGWFFWTFISAPIEKVLSYTGYHLPEQWKFTTENLLVYIGLAYMLRVIGSCVARFVGIFCCNSLNRLLTI